MCCLSAEFFTGHSESEFRKFSLISFTRNLETIGFHRSNVWGRVGRLCLLMLCTMFGWPEVISFSKADAQGEVEALLLYWIRESPFTSTVLQKLRKCLQIPISPSPLGKEDKWIKLCVRAKSLQSRPTLRDLVDCSPPGSSVHGILQTRILEWLVIPFSRGSSQPRDWTQVSCIASRFFTNWATFTVINFFLITSF